MKLIALDVGTKRIGVAKADTEVKIAVPSGVIEVNGDEFKQIASFARVYGTDFFIVGLPRNSKGEETAQSKYVRDFVKKLKTVIPTAKVRFQDESLTSVIAEERLQGKKGGYKKGEIDAGAAAIILQDFLESFMPSKKGTKKSKSKKSGHTTRNVIFSILFVLLLILVGGFVFYKANLAQVDTDCSNPEKNATCVIKTFQVEDGDGVKAIADNLKKEGLIRNSLVFQLRYLLGYHNVSLKAGEYSFSAGMTVNEIIDALVKGADEKVFSFTIIPGETIMKIKEKLLELGYDKTEVDEAFSKTYDNPILAERPEGASLEGYLFSDTYEFYQGETVENIIKTALEEMEKAINNNGLVEKFKNRGRTLYEGITMASIVQGEVRGTEDMKKVSQVFYKRLNLGVPLGSDATVAYAVNLVDPNREVYTDNAAALEIDSPYNTRKRLGLPFGPVNNPGMDALKAAAEPADTDYLYFLTGDDGIVYYSNTDAEHQQNIIDHCQQLCNVQL